MINTVIMQGEYYAKAIIVESAQGKRLQIH